MTMEHPKLQLISTPPKIRSGHIESFVTPVVGSDPGPTVLVRLDDQESLSDLASALHTKYNGATEGEDAVLRQLRSISLPPSSGEDLSDRERINQTTRIVELVTSRAELFHSDGLETFARVNMGAHHETFDTTSSRFKVWVAGEYFRDAHMSPNSAALQDASNTLRAQALYDGSYRKVFLRTAPDGAGGFYVDLANANRHVVHVTPGGARVLSDAPVEFVRPDSMQPLPVPVFGGDFSKLRRYINVSDDDAWVLLKAFMRAAIRDCGPYPVLVILGEHGSAKSSAARFVRCLIDPGRPALRMVPRKVDDLVVAARNSWFPVFDNVSHIEPWLSDALCCLSTGMGFSTRMHYTHNDEAIYEAMRPTALTSITEVVNKEDLLDRVVLVNLLPIPSKGRRTEKSLWKSFQADHAAILGALLEDVARALKAQPDVHIPDLPRMADFALWAVSAERGREEPARFMDVYAGVRESAYEQSISESVIWPALKPFIKDRLPWEGTTSELLASLKTLAPEESLRDKMWPRSARGLTSILRYLAPALRHQGTEIAFPSKRTRQAGTGDRILRITRTIPLDDDPAPGRDEVPSSDDCDDLCDDCDDLCDGPNGQIIADRHTPKPNDSAGFERVCDDVTVVTMSPVGELYREEYFSSDAPLHVLTTAAEVEQALPDMMSAQYVGLDTETVGLDPYGGEMRLVQVATPRATYVIDAFKVDARTLSPLLEEGPILMGHNLEHEIKFLTRAGLPIPQGARFFDSQLASEMLAASSPKNSIFGWNLARTAKHYLDVDLDKTLQKSDWTGDLTEAQMRYAALDARIMLPLYDKLSSAITEAGLAGISALEMRCLPGLVWMEMSGAPFDGDAWTALSERAMTDVVRLEQEMASLVGKSDLFGRCTVNFNSPVQLLALFRERGHDIPNTREESLAELAARGDDLAILLLDYRQAKTRSSRYGIEYLTNVNAITGRIHCDYAQIGTVSGRMSCSKPNLQQVPRDPCYRACFTPAPGRTLVKADYSQVELRIAAEMAGDQIMMEAFASGADLHELTARLVLGKQDIDKAARQAAKAVNFGLIYGMGAASLQTYAATNYGAHLSLEEAKAARTLFFRSYPGLRAWHNSQSEGPVDTRTVLGRRRQGVSHFTEKLNTPVQGSGADGQKAALALMWETRHQCPHAFPVLCVHDEYVIECDADKADEAQTWLVGCMERGMRAVLRQVPVVVESSIRPNWSES